jgi:hypothetical protein
MISDREAEIINKLLDITEKERDKIWFFSSEAPYIILETPLPPHLRGIIKKFVAPMKHAMDLQYFLRLIEVPELKETYESYKHLKEEERESKFMHIVNNMIERIAHSICDVIEESGRKDYDFEITLTLYKCYHPKTDTFYLTTYVIDHYELYRYQDEPYHYQDFSFYLTRDKLRAYELYTETKRKHALQRKTSTEKAESVQMA